jgi:DNA-binding Lrp family transcriptional regulator
MAERAELITAETPSAAPARGAAPTGPGSVSPTGPDTGPPAASGTAAPTGADTASSAGSDRASAAIPKTRSRRDGAAVALDEGDRRLLNLMQGSFPIEPRPYAAVASAAGIAEERVLERVAQLLEQRIIRQVTPIYDTRALGYSSMLVAAKVDPEHPWRAAKIVNSHPGVSHNYLRNHDFNMWFTLATEPDSPLGLEGTLELLGELIGAESVRQLPTLKLFKIRMDLEMEGDTKALASEGAEQQEALLESVAYDELDIAVIRATQGDMPVVSEPYVPAAQRLGMEVDALLEHMRGMQERGLLRRVAAILFHRRAGFSANGMGVWKVPTERIAELGPRMAAFRGISHCYQRPTYEDWPYSVFTMAHGRSKDECDAILDAIAEQTGIEERATLYSSTEFKKVRLMYFTDDYKRWEAQHV